MEHQFGRWPKRTVAASASAEALRVGEAAVAYGASVASRHARRLWVVAEPRTAYHGTPAPGGAQPADAGETFPTDAGEALTGLAAAADRMARVDLGALGDRALLEHAVERTAN